MKSEMFGERWKDGVGAEEVGSLLDRLVSTLEQHVQNHRGLLRAMEEKKEACIAVALPDLEAIMVREREAIEAIGASEEERSEVMTDLEEAMGFKGPGRMRLLDLINRVGEDHREVLLEMRDDLRGIADSVDRLNRLNRTLVLHSIENMHLYLVMLGGGSPEEETTCSRGGAEGGRAGSLLLDRRI